MNDLVLIQTSQGLAKYVLHNAMGCPDVVSVQHRYPDAHSKHALDWQAKKAGVVIGFDARHNSKRWARLSAGAFLREGFKVMVS